MRRFAGRDSLVALRCALAEALPLSSLCSRVGPAWRNAGPDAQRVREVHPLLAPWAEPPVDVLVPAAAAVHSSSIVHPMVWSHELPFGSRRQVVDDVYVTSPAFTMLQLASRASLVRTVLMASELCGSFAVYRPPAPLAAYLQKLIDSGVSLELGGWRPSVSGGRLTDLWVREPLVEPSDLLRIAAVSDSPKGRARLQKATELVVPGAASPFEVQTGIMLGFPRRLGGEGLGGFTHNEKIALTREARLLAQRDACYCDLHWEAEGLDLECQSAQHHDNEPSYLADSDRSAALKSMGIDVLQVTYGQLVDEQRFEAFSGLVASSLGRGRLPKKTQKQLLAARELRDEVFTDWIRLPEL